MRPEEACDEEVRRVEGCSQVTAAQGGPGVGQGTSQVPRTRWEKNSAGSLIQGEERSKEKAAETLRGATTWWG